MLEKAGVLNSTVQISPPPVVLSSLGELRRCSLFTTWRPVSSWFNFIKSLNNAWSQLLKSEHLIYVKVFGLLRRTHLTLRAHWGLAEPTTSLTARQALHVLPPLLRFLPSCLCQTLASPSATGTVSFSGSLWSQLPWVPEAPPSHTNISTHLTEGQVISCFLVSNCSSLRAETELCMLAAYSLSS